LVRFRLIRRFVLFLRSASGQEKTQVQDLLSTLLFLQMARASLQ